MSDLVVHKLSEKSNEGFRLNAIQFFFCRLAALEKAETQRTVIKTEKVDADENKNNEEQDEEAFDDSDQVSMYN